MKTLSAREYLGQLQEFDININQEIERLENMKLNACGTSGIDYSSERVQTSSSGDGLSRQVTNYVSLNEKINNRIDLYTDAREKIIEQIRGLHNNYFNQILFKVYVQYKSVRQVAEEMHRSYNYTVELHNKALTAFEETYKNLTYLI